MHESGHPVPQCWHWELTNRLRRTATINWRNRLRFHALKVLLAKHKYPPDKQPEAIEKIITQAELLADTWAEDRSPENA